MPLIKKCKICDKKFRTKPFFVKHGGGKYCSADCHHQGLRKGVFKKCFICGKDSYKKPLQLKRSKSGKFFCSKSCQTKWRNTEFIGPRHANWVDGENAYRSVLTRNKIPSVCTLCKTRDKRILAVHHIDKNRKNNKLSNLAWLCNNCHFLVHHYDVEREKFMEALV